jgi:3-hydroxyisobutyrate dehydrogenase-like beta-hydroxyacid dehydrogenase
LQRVTLVTQLGHQPSGSHHAGEAGVGPVAKHCNNLLAGISMIAVSEAFAPVKHLRLDAPKMQRFPRCPAAAAFP